MFWAELIIDIMLILFGFLIGAGSMAGFQLNNQRNEVSEAYLLGYEMGRKAEQAEREGDVSGCQEVFKTAKKA